MMLRNIAIFTLLCAAASVLAVGYFSRTQGSARWVESAIPFSQDHQWELICDANYKILAVVQPDDGGGFVVYGGDRVAYGVYVDLRYAQKAGEDLDFYCPTTHSK
jgi:hypothetical protein